MKSDQQRAARVVVAVNCGLSILALLALVRYDLSHAFAQEVRSAVRTIEFPIEGPIQGTEDILKSTGILSYQRSELDLPVFGDGGVFSSIRDLLRWQELYYGGHVLKPATLAQALQPGTLDRGTTVGYGCGVIVEDMGDGRRWCGHDGAWSGAASFLGRWVEDCLSVVVLSNDQHAQVTRIAQRSLAAWRRRQT